MSDDNASEHLEFYSASVNAWYNSALEHDKSLLTLSAGGIGLLITLLTTVGLKSILALVLYALAIICFVISLVCVLWIFNANRIHIVKLFQGEESLDDPTLVKLDHVAIWSFGAAVIFTAFIGISTASQAYITEDSKKTNPMKANESFNGATSLQNKSYSGVQPQKATNPTPLPQPPTTQTTSSPVPANASSKDKK